VSSAAVALATTRLGSLDDRRVLVIGAGKMGTAAAVAIAGAGARELVVANRTPEHAEELAQRVEGRAIALEDVPAALDSCDVVLAATAAPDVLLERDAFEALMARRGGRALLAVDIGMPRNLDPGAREVFGVSLIDIDDLRAFGEHSLAQRRQEITAVREMIAGEVHKHRAERSARQVAPLVTALRARAEELRLGELERFRARLGALDPATADAVDALTQGIVNKLLHEPTVQVKRAAGTSRGELYADTLAQLFALPEPPRDAEG
jgi:glutamyl-tRNA reductase